MIDGEKIIRALEGDPLVGPYAKWATRRLEER